MDQLINYAPEIALYQSSIPPVTAIPLGAPLTSGATRDFRAASWLSSKKDKDELKGSREEQVVENVVSRRTITDPARVHLSLSELCAQVVQHRDL